MKTVKMICIGAGARGMYAYAPYAKSNPDALMFTAVAEPIPERREQFAQAYGVPPDAVFADWRDALHAGIDADAVLVTTQDRAHVEPACEAMRMGYDVMLEKPVSPDAAACLRVEQTARETGRHAVVCHVLRYTVFFSKLKELLDSGCIGEIVSVVHNENIGYWHMAHSYVRGNWCNSEKSSPILLAKSCHDIDILLYLIGSRCRRVASFGSLSHFVPKNRPDHAADRCLDCRVEEDCPYSAKKLYLDMERWEWPVSVISDDLSEEGRLHALREGPYGQCVYACNNNVPDHQSTILEFENGVTACFGLNALTRPESSRTLRIMGTRGEIRASLSNDAIEVYDFQTNMAQTIDISGAVHNEYAHGGGDYGLIDAFVKMEQGEDVEIKTDIAASIHSHMICLAAEEARRTGTVVDVDAYVSRIASAGG